MPLSGLNLDSSLQCSLVLKIFTVHPCVYLTCTGYMPTQDFCQFTHRIKDPFLQPSPGGFFPHSLPGDTFLVFVFVFVFVLFSFFVVVVVF